MTNNPAPDVIVIGAGAFGLWTALSAAECGARVAVIDMREVGNVRASSGGPSRNIRAGYGKDAFYTQLAITARAAWQQREAQIGQRLLYPAGALISRDPELFEAQAKIFSANQQPFEMLDGAEVKRRWPVLNYSPEERVFYEPQAGVLLAGGTLRLIGARLRELGGSIVQGRVSFGVDGSKPTCILDGRRLEAARIVVAAGPWLPKLFPKLIGPLMRMPRRELFFFAAPPEDKRVNWEHLPSLSDHQGWTSTDIGGGVKVAPHMRHVALDPDADPGLPTAAMARAARAYLAARIPLLADTPIVSTYVGQLENTANEDFIIDTHPDDERIVIAGGGSGHAFKFGPVLGERIADFALHGTMPADWRARFAISSHRAVGPGEAG